MFHLSCRTFSCVPFYQPGGGESQPPGWMSVNKGSYERERLLRPIGLDIINGPCSFMHCHFNTNESITAFITDNISILQYDFYNTVDMSILQNDRLTFRIFIISNHGISWGTYRILTFNRFCIFKINLEFRI